MKSRGLGPAFNGLWGATAASNLADGLAITLLPLLAVGLAASPGEVAAVTFASTAVWPVFGIVGGLIVDAANKRTILSWVSFLRAAAFGLLAVTAATDSISLPILYAVAVTMTVGEVLADTSMTSMVPAIVPASRRGAANARVESTINLLNGLAGPPLAGLLIGIGAALATGTTAALYALALVGLAFVPRGPFARVPHHHDQTRRLRTELIAGMREIWTVVIVRKLTIFTAMMNVTWGIWAAIFVIYATDPDLLDLSPQAYGLLLAVMSIGGFVIAPFIDWMTRALGVRTVLTIDLVGTVLLVAPAALGMGVVPVAIGLVLAGVGTTIWRTVAATIRQNQVHGALLGRVYAASRTISWGVLPFAAAIAGAVSEVWSVRAAMGLASVLALLTTVFVVWSIRGIDLNRAYAGDDES